MFPDLFKLGDQKTISVFQMKNGEVQISICCWFVDDLTYDWEKKSGGKIKLAGSWVIKVDFL